MAHTFVLQSFLMLKLHNYQKLKVFSAHFEKSHDFHHGRMIQNLTQLLNHFRNISTKKICFTLIDSSLTF